jgi:hypothetical protein
MTKLALPGKIVSGGQTGVDQAALTVAIRLSIPHGGWCPLGRRCEAGVIPSQFQLLEMPTPSYAARTRQNVIDSDATLILYRDQLAGGSLLTRQIADQLQQPLFLWNLEGTLGAREIFAWFRDCDVATLNVAGPRESTSPGINAQACGVLTELLLASEP